ncbi:hypothetical protein Rhopal_000546-T1 [Rhodotorula paludigena]|uniref:BED-type domain-containing protein n=1 Tax=Rhodotorula paludigena TaxID=86838 RepID=A0AAV5G538_9BASI|nr:hypothetical protein Rhopal_000546-T1 [Rhodotorula paludigena]
MPFKRSISNVSFASTLLDESSDGSLSPTSTLEDVKPAIEDVKPVIEEDIKPNIKSIKREDTPHPLAKKSKTRGITGNDETDIKKAQEKHIESGSPSAAKFEPPILAVSPTHTIKGRIRLTTLACKGCGTTVQRAISSSSTDKLADHIKKCSAELPEVAQATLEALGITGSNSIQPEEVLQTLVTWIAENSRPFRLVNDRQVSTPSTPRTAAARDREERKREEHRLRLVMLARMLAREWRRFGKRFE